MLQFSQKRLSYIAVFAMFQEANTCYNNTIKCEKHRQKGGTLDEYRTENPDLLLIAEDGGTCEICTAAGA